VPNKLKPDELHSRLRFDWAIAQKMNGPLVCVQAFKSLADLSRRKNPVITQQECHRASAYLAEFHVRSLVGGGEFHDNFQVSIDLLAGGDYPFSEPACFVTSRPIPWSPHFLPSKGAICLGELWGQAGGAMTLGHLLVHVAKLLNFDEPDREPSYGGWNAAAVNYWRRVLHRRPITEGLAYPSLPAEITHAIEIPQKPLFKPAAAALVAAARPHFRPKRR
jgi:ubiquitin-protein ligase